MIVNNTRSNKIVFFLVFLSLIVALDNGACSAEMLEYFRVVVDKSTYDQHPEKFEVLIFKDRAGPYETYVERTSSLAIDSAEIKSVSIERARRPYEDNKATISLSEKAGKALKEFAKTRKQELFDVRFGKSRLAIVQFHGSYEERAEESYEFTVYLEETDLDRLKKIFDPIKNKVNWK